MVKKGYNLDHKMLNFWSKNKVICLIKSGYVLLKK